MRLRRITLAVVGALLLPLLATADTYQKLHEESLARLWEHRADARGIVDLYRASDLLEDIDSRGPLSETLARVVAAPDADPEVKAHCAHQLAMLRRDAGRQDEADGLEAALGYVTHWRVMGPFEDENKQGYDMPFPPEIELAYEGSFKGKGHPVSWRKVPRMIEGGVVPLDQVLDPSEKVAGYALAFLKVSADTPCVLRGGYNEAYKLWVNGDLVAGRKEYNGRAFDQFTDPCTLRKGWNILLVKVCNQDAGWNFHLRVTDARGGALPGLTVSDDPAQVNEKREAILAKDGLPPKGFTVGDPQATLADRAAGEGAKAEDLLAYGLYLSFLRIGDRTDDRNVQVLKRAVKAAPDDPEAWAFLGDASRDHNDQRAAYQSGLERRPENVPLLERLGRYYLDLGMPFPALQIVGRARKADPESPSLRALEDRIRLQFVADGLAAADLKALQAAHPENPSVLEACLAAARVVGEATEVERLSELTRVNNQTDSGSWFSRIADLAKEGRQQEVIGLYKVLSERFPMDRLVIFRYASYLLSLSRPEEAGAVLAPALEWSPDWPEGHDLLGDVRLALGRKEEALSEYAQALILRPQLEALKRKVAYLSPVEDDFETPFRVEQKELPSDLGSFAGQPAVILLDNTVVRVQPSGLSSRYVQEVIQVLQAGVAQQLQYWPITFDPDREEVRVLEASILKADGRRVHAETMVTDALQDPEYRLYYRNRNMILEFPSLSAGDRVWIEYKVSDIGDDNDYGSYFGDLVPFATRLPILQKQYTLVVPESLKLFQHQERLETQPIVLSKGGEKTFRWVVRDVDRTQLEPDMPGFLEVVPYLHVSTFPDGDALGAWYAKFIADQWETSPEVKAKVAELVKGAGSQEEKVRAIHRWVVQQTHYVGLEFGVHGIRPYKVRQVFERRFGDCKDKATLLASMLKEAGMDACLVLVRTRDNGEIKPTPASLAIFNHCIAYVPELDLFLDGTAEYSGMRELPYQDRGIWVQLVWPDGRTKRVQTPMDSPDANIYDADYRMLIAGESPDVRIEAKVAVTGQECSWMRRRYQDENKQAEMLEKDLSGGYPGTRLEEAEFGPLADLGTPVRFSYRGVLGQAAKPDGKGRISLPVWMGHLNLLYNLATLQERTLPLEVDYPWRQCYRVTYALPPGAVASPLSPLDVRTPFGTLKRTSEQRGDGLVVSITVELSAHRVSPAQYSEFKSFCQVAERATEERLRVTLQGGGQ